MTVPPPAPPSPQRDATPVLALIRIVMVTGLVALGAVVWFMGRRGAVVPEPGVDLEMLRWIGITAGVLAAVGILGLRARITRNPRLEPRRQTFTIIGWALGEAVALFGAMYFFLTGNSTWFLGGFFVAMAAFVLLPARPPA